MYCISCQYFEQTCKQVKIYACGYIYECPFYGINEPVIAPTGCNFQIMSESISHPEGTEYVDISLVRKPGKLTWYAKIMICYEGHGTVITTEEEITLPGVSIWVGWQRALNEIKKLNKSILIPLIPLIEARIRFDHSVIEYGKVWKPQYQKLEDTEVQTQDRRPVKPRKIVIPENTDHLLDITTPENSEKAAGDQMDLFAV